MKPILTLSLTSLRACIIVVSLLSGLQSIGQISVVCTSPTNTAYGLTNAGEIYEINTTTAATIRVIKNSTYAGNAPSSANGIGYNSFNGKFYYFKRNVTAGPQEFVSFSPATNTVANLANSTCTDDIHTGCVSYNGAGYYTTDIQGTLHYYNIATNKWTFITSKIVDQNGNNITTLIKTQSAGDMAIDGLGNMWLLTSSSSNYGLYKFPANLPTTAVAQVNVICAINPTAVTPTGNSFAGIAFKPNGQVLMTTRGDDKLYLLQATNTLTFIGNLTTADVGNDLTACVFPAGILPVTWKSFSAILENNFSVGLKWEVIESNNKGFYVEHSTDGTNWTDLTFIVAQNNPASVDEYSYTHTNHLNGRHYYRIKQVDIDGNISYSEIATVVIKSSGSDVAVWPNPASEFVRIVSADPSVSPTRAQIFDLSGRLALDISVAANKNTINVNKLPTGTYLVKVQLTNGMIVSDKLVKQ